MKIVIMGGSGFIGSQLSQTLLALGHSVVIASRRYQYFRHHAAAHFAEHYIPFTAPALRSATLTQNKADNVALVNLAGESITQGRWTRKKRQQILTSRLHATQLVHHVLAGPCPPSVVIQASAIGRYDERSAGVFAETSLAAETTSAAQPNSPTFLNHVCQQWETAFFTPPPPLAAQQKSRPQLPPTRKVCLRIPIVLGKDGGAFYHLARIFKWGLGANNGSGRHGLSWIHLTDLIALVVLFLTTPALSGIFNACAPYPVEMRLLTKLLAEKLHRPLLPPIPKLLLALSLGEKSSLLTTGAFIRPQRILTETSFQYTYPTLEQALANLAQN